MSGGFAFASARCAARAPSRVTRATPPPPDFAYLCRAALASAAACPASDRLERIGELRPLVGRQDAAGALQGAADVLASLGQLGAEPREQGPRVGTLPRALYRRLQRVRHRAVLRVERIGDRLQRGDLIG